METRRPSFFLQSMGNTNRVDCYIDNMSKHFDYLVCEQ